MSVEATPTDWRAVADLMNEAADEIEQLTSERDRAVAALEAIEDIVAKARGAKEES